MKTQPIKAKTGFRHMPAEDLLATSTHIFTEIYNVNFTPPQALAPPVDQATLKSANDTLAAAIGAVLGGGTQATAQKNQAKDVVVKYLYHLAFYAQANCKDDMTIFLSSGFKPVSSTKTMPPPVSESIRKVEPGPLPGQMVITLVKYPGAASYEVRWATVPAAGALPVWASMPVAKVRPSTVISDLTPLTPYIFEARAVTNDGYSNWSTSVTRVTK